MIACNRLLILIEYFLLILVSPPTKGPNCRTHPTDLVFIIDSSRSVRPSEFEQVKVFLSQVIESLDVGINSTRVGVVNYASSVKNEFSLKTHKSKAALLQAVKKIQPLSTGTMTGLAIQYAINQAFTEGEGARLKSAGVKKVSSIYIIYINKPLGKITLSPINQKNQVPSQKSIVLRCTNCRPLHYEPNKMTCLHTITFTCIISIWSVL